MYYIGSLGVPQVNVHLDLDLINKISFSIARHPPFYHHVLSLNLPSHTSCVCSFVSFSIGNLTSQHDTAFLQSHYLPADKLRIQLRSKSKRKTSRDVKDYQGCEFHRHVRQAKRNCFCNKETMLTTPCSGNVSCQLTNCEWMAMV